MSIFIIFIITVLSGAIFTRIAISLNILDVPNYRKIHKQAVPKAGGIGIIIPVLGVMLWLMSNEAIKNDMEILTVIFITVFLGVVGLIDDKIDLPAKTKLLLQTIAAAVTVFQGIQLELPFPEPFQMLISFIWILGFINAMNLIDGLDGLAGGIGAIAAGGILIIGLIYANYYVIYVAIALGGSLVGFLWFNRHPARIFMGDTGSLTVGYLLAVLIIESGNTIGGLGGATIAFFLVLVPIYDMMLSICRRKLHHKPVFSPDRSHFYNLLMDQFGVSHKRTVLLIYIVSIILAVISLNMLLWPIIIRYIIFIIAILVIIILTVRLGLLKVDEK